MAIHPRRSSNGPGRCRADLTLSCGPLGGYVSVLISSPDPDLRRVDGFSLHMLFCFFFCVCVRVRVRVCGDMYWY